jgi:hypothetical protein
MHALAAVRQVASTEEAATTSQLLWQPIIWLGHAIRKLPALFKGPTSVCAWLQSAPPQHCCSTGKLTQSSVSEHVAQRCPSYQKLAPVAAACGFLVPLFARARKAPRLGASWMRALRLLLVLAVLLLMLEVRLLEQAPLVARVLAQLVLVLFFPAFPGQPEVGSSASTHGALCSVKPRIWALQLNAQTQKTTLGP